jgi:hypothetical protein
MNSWRDDEEFKKALEPWARNLLIASVATHLRIQFRSAEKYVPLEQQIGDFWYELAAAVWRVLGSKGPVDSISASTKWIQ